MSFTNTMIRSALLLILLVPSVHAAEDSDYLIVPYVINPVTSPTTFREMARECMNNETCGAAVDAVAAYVGVPPGTIKETMDTADSIGLGPPQRRQEGEQYWFEIDPPDGYFLCRAHLKIISAAPLDGRRTPTFGFSAQETSGVDAYAFVHRQGFGKGRSWVEAVYTATYLNPHSPYERRFRPVSVCDSIGKSIA